MHAQLVLHAASTIVRWYKGNSKLRVAESNPIVDESYAQPKVPRSLQSPFVIESTAQEQPTKEVSRPQPQTSRRPRVDIRNKTLRNKAGNFPGIPDALAPRRQKTPQPPAPRSHCPARPLCTQMWKSRSSRYANGSGSGIRGGLPFIRNARSNLGAERKETRGGGRRCDSRTAIATSGSGVFPEFSVAGTAPCVGNLELAGSWERRTESARCDPITRKFELQTLAVKLNTLRRSASLRLTDADGNATVQFVCVLLRSTFSRSQSTPVVPLWWKESV